MFKRIALFAALITVLAAVPALALDFQQKSFYGQGVVTLPMGDFGDVAKLGIGAGVGMTVPHTEQITFRGEISYIYYTTEDFGDADVSVSQIPVMVLGQYNMTDSDLYLLGGLGLVFSKLDMDVEFSYEGYTYSDSASDSSTDLGLVLGAGYNLKPGMVLEGRFNMVSDANSVSAHVGFSF